MADAIPPERPDEAAPQDRPRRSLGSKMMIAGGVWFLLALPSCMLGLMDIADPLTVAFGWFGLGGLFLGPVLALVGFLAALVESRPDLKKRSR